MRYKSDIHDYDSIEIRSMKEIRGTANYSGQRRHPDVQALAELMKENDEIIALRIIPIGYDADLNVEATLKSAPDLKDIATPISIDHEVYIVKNAYYKGFVNNFGSTLSKTLLTSKTNTTMPSVKTVQIEVKPEVKEIANIVKEAATAVTTKVIRSCVDINHELNDLFAIGKKQGMNITNFKSHRYYRMMQEVIADSVKSVETKLDIQDTMQFINNDADFAYIVESLLD